MNMVNKNCDHQRACDGIGLRLIACEKLGTLLLLLCRTSNRECIQTEWSVVTDEFEGNGT